jgi:23S rRNA (guanosine2251-2'-O)-methyltransferase
MNKIQLQLILSNLRGAGNVGSILRTADACGVQLVRVSGYTPYPTVQGDTRPPYISGSNTRAIAKTALGAELSVPILHTLDPLDAVREAKRNGFFIIVLEQTESSLNIFNYQPLASKIALVFGNEVTGVEPEVIEAADLVLEIPMIGQKESLNVAAAAAIAMYQLSFGTVSALI